MYAAIFVGSMFFPALATIFKERVFGAAKKRLNGQSLDLFVVNSYGSAAQALFIFLLLPVVSSLRGISLSQLLSYLKEGVSARAGRSSSSCLLNEHFIFLLLPMVSSVRGISLSQLPSYLKEDGEPPACYSSAWKCSVGQNSV